MTKRTGLNARNSSVKAAIAAAGGASPNEGNKASSGKVQPSGARVVGLTLRLDAKTHDRLRRVSFDSRKSIHSLLLEGVEMMLKKYE